MKANPYGHKIARVAFLSIQDSNSVVLKFPLARLYVINQLNGESVGCARAMIGAAYDSGLVTEGCLDGFMADIEGAGPTGGCSALLAARHLAEKRLELTHGQEANAIAESIISQVAEEIEIYRTERRKLCQTPTQEGCRQMAPIIFDFLLQALHKT